MSSIFYVEIANVYIWYLKFKFIPIEVEPYRLVLKFVDVRHEENLFDIYVGSVATMRSLILETYLYNDLKTT